MSNKPIQRINKSATEGNVDLTPINRSISNITSQLAEMATVVAVDGLGAKGDNLTDDTDIIQTALDKASSVKTALILFTYGKKYRITRPLVVDDNTTLFGHGAEIAAGSTRGNMIYNKGYVDSVRNKNISIIGLTINSYDYTSPTDDFTQLRCIFHHVDNLTIRDCRFLSERGKYMVSLGDTKDVLIDNTYYDCSSDCIHLLGKNYRTTISNLYNNRSGDDCIGLTTLDYPQYRFEEGDVKDLTISNIYSNSHTRCVMLESDGGYVIENVNVSNIYPNSTELGVRIGSWDRTTNTGHFDNITIENVNGEVLFQHSDIRRISVKNIRKLGFDSLSQTINTKVDNLQAENVGYITMDTTKTYEINKAYVKGLSQPSKLKDFETLILEDYFFDASTYDAIGIYGNITNLFINNSKITTTSTEFPLIALRGDFEINNFVINNSILHTASNNGTMLIQRKSGNCNINKLTYNNCDIIASKIFDSYVPSGVSKELRLILNNSDVDCQRFLDLMTYYNLAITVNNSSIKSAREFVYVQNNNTIKVFGNTLSDVYTYAFSGAGNFYSYSDDFVVNIQQIKPVAKGRCYNANASASCGIGYCISDGTLWKNVVTGATYTPS